MAGGALLGGLSLIAVGLGNNLLWIGVAWTFAAGRLNGLQAPLTAVIPDRTPEHRRGVFSSAAGLAQMLRWDRGHGSRGCLCPRARPRLRLLRCPRRRRHGGLPAPQQGARRLRPGRRTVPLGRPSLAGFWVSPRQHPDFAWAFLGRFLLILGYYVVYSYQLYILDDYLGLTRDRANELWCRC